MKAQTAVKKTAEKAVGTSKGGKNTKIHTLVDGLGNPLAFLLSSGNDHDSVHAIPLLKKFEIAGSNILGDKAYGAQKIRDYISEQNASYTIPPKENNPDPWFVDWHTYKERHLVECFFQKIKWFRRISTRYDKTDFGIALLEPFGNLYAVHTAHMDIQKSDVAAVLFCLLQQIILIVIG